MGVPIWAPEAHGVSNKDALGAQRFINKLCMLCTLSSFPLINQHPPLQVCTLSAGPSLGFPCPSFGVCPHHDGDRPTMRCIKNMVLLCCYRTVFSYPMLHTHTPQVRALSAGPTLTPQSPLASAPSMMAMGNRPVSGLSLRRPKSSGKTMPARKSIDLASKFEV